MVDGRAELQMQIEEEIEKAIDRDDRIAITTIEFELIVTATMQAIDSFIAETVVDDGELKEGDRVRYIRKPTLRTKVKIGDTGTIMALRDSKSRDSKSSVAGDLDISWDGLTIGHNGEGHVSNNSCWFVSKDEVERIPHDE